MVRIKMNNRMKKQKGKKRGSAWGNQKSYFQGGPWLLGGPAHPGITFFTADKDSLSRAQIQSEHPLKSKLMAYEKAVKLVNQKQKIYFYSQSKFQFLNNPHYTQIGILPNLGNNNSIMDLLYRESVLCECIYNTNILMLRHG